MVLVLDTMDAATNCVLPVAAEVLNQLIDTYSARVGALNAHSLGWVILVDFLKSMMPRQLEEAHIYLTSYTLLLRRLV